MSWTDERVEQLKKLWMDGLSASQIALELGGITRNAVIGKVHRLGLSGRAKTSSHASASRQKRTQRAQPKPVRSAQRPLLNTQMKLTAEASADPYVDESLVAPVALRLELTQLTERTCKWPIGDPALEDFHFCGNASPEAGPYCSYHSRIAYQAVPERRRDRRMERAY
jgi:GcrA cell cycle regulator